MAGNTIMLTVAGDSTSLERAFQRVGTSAKGMAQDFDTAKTHAKTLGQGVDDARGKFDTGEQRIIGFRDALTGTGDVMRGLKEGDMTLLATGFADLFSSMSNFLLPALGTLSTTLKTQLGGALSFIAAHPVVFTLAALAAAFVLLWKNSETFRDIVKGALEAVGRAAENVWNFFKDLPNKLLGVGSAVKDAVLSPFKSAFNAIASLWNNTVGKLSFKVPSWVPSIGGKGFDMPNIPTMKFHAGGVVPGRPGTEVPAMLLAGERVLTPGQAGGGGRIININVAGSVITERDLGRVVADALRNNQLLGVT